MGSRQINVGCILVCYVCLGFEGKVDGDTYADGYHKANQQVGL